MIEARAPLPMQAPPDRALVVFIRPSSYAGGQLFTIIDDQGQFLGDALPSSYFVSPVLPGDHLFVGWAENTCALRASLLPGRTYYVEVAARMGFWSSRLQLLAIKPSVESWAELPEWLADSQPLLVAQQSGQAYVNGRRDDVAERLQSARQIYGEYSAEELAARTLRPEDGAAPRAMRIFDGPRRAAERRFLGLLAGDRTVLF